MEQLTIDLESRLKRSIDGLDWDRASGAYGEQNEFVFLDRFLPPEVLDQLLPEVDRARTDVHRNYIPGHKKGGSVSYYTLVRKAPVILTLYRSPAFMDFLSRLAGARLLTCPDTDPHACALYFYTEPGDHIGFHYDTSYYKGARYTVLLGLVQRSRSQLACQLYRGDATRETRELSISVEPGSMIFFNGDKLYHAVTPLGEGEERVVLTLEYVTNPEMGALKRFVSNMKDALAYFGPGVLLRRGRFGRGGDPDVHAGGVGAPGWPPSE